MSNELKVTVSGGTDKQRERVFDLLHHHLRTAMALPSWVGGSVSLEAESPSPQEEFDKAAKQREGRGPAPEGATLEHFTSEHGRPEKDGEINLGYPDGNPKTALGTSKLPLNLVPPVAVQHLALAFKDGALKYGPYNWRDAKVSSTVYYAAALRHLFAWFDGQDNAEDSGVHHLAHAMACCAILLDAASVDKLNDNRPTAGAGAAMQKEFTA